MFNMFSQFDHLSPHWITHFCYIPMFFVHIFPPPLFLPVFSMCFYIQKQYISPACMNDRLVVVHQHLIMENESNAQFWPVGLPLMVQLSLELAQRRLRRNLRRSYMGRVCCFWCFLGSTIAQKTAIVKGSETEEQQNVALWVFCWSRKG